MLKSALDYFGNPNLTQTSDSSPSSSTDDPMIGSNVDVGGIKILVKRRIGEGGFAFVYEAVDAETRSRSYALKRLLAVDKEKRAAIVQEISILKTLSSHNRIVSFVTSANGNRQVSPGRSIEEFLVLMEYCPTVLSDVLQARSTSYPPDAVARIFTQVMDAVSVLHSSNPPIVHRDLKLENLLINSKRNGIKLCDFGSATTETFHPNMNWTMNQRTTLEEETAKHTTPMYRAPEMLDTWSNYSVDTKADIWACGCLLFVLCFHHHPFEDSAKLAIVNGNYRIPPNDTKYTMFHDLIRQMLTVDPSLRPDSNQVLQHLTGVSLSNGIDPTLDIDFEIAPSNSPTVENIPNLRTPTASFYDHSSPSKQPQQTSPQALQSSQAGSAGLMSSIKGGAGSFMKNIRDKSHSVIQTVQHSMATKELDMHCITERIAAMSYPADGLESAFKNHIDDISATIESKHSNKVYYSDLNDNYLPSVPVVSDLISITEEDRTSTVSLSSLESHLSNDSTYGSCYNLEFGDCNNNIEFKGNNSHHNTHVCLNTSVFEPNYPKHESTIDSAIDNLMNNLSLNRSHNHRNDNIYTKHVRTTESTKNGYRKMDQKSPRKTELDCQFEDLLSAYQFTPQSKKQPQTIGEMNNLHLRNNQSPAQELILAWKNGKERNLRSLLCSLHTILWDEAKWQKCNLNQLITDRDVNIRYKMACKAVHPDKNRGTDYEELSTLIQIELNDAWDTYKQNQN